MKLSTITLGVLAVAFILSIALIMYGLHHSETYAVIRDEAERLTAKEQLDRTLHEYKYKNKGCVKGKPWIKVEKDSRAWIMAGNTFTLSNSTHVPLLYRMYCSLEAEVPDEEDGTSRIAGVTKQIVVGPSQGREVVLKAETLYNPDLTRRSKGRYRLDCDCVVTEHKVKGDLVLLKE